MEELKRYQGLGKLSHLALQFLTFLILQFLNNSLDCKSFSNSMCSIPVKEGKHQQE